MEVAALRSGDPERLGPYALVGRIGEGGQGTVFLAEDADGARVALKLLHSDLTEDERARARFLRELEVAKKVAPFCTAQVLDADATGDRPYIVSEYVPGPSLNELVTRQGPLGGSALERLAVGTATALAAIHQAGIIHRDFKPHNVLIGTDGPRLIDFGVARAISGTTTVTSKVIGTPSYMAPEQLEGEEVGPPADVFCWAATLVFAATGEPPFGQDTIPAVINRILHNEPDLGELDGPLRDLVEDCMTKVPGDRPDARELLMRLLGQGQLVPTKGPSLKSAAVAADEESHHGEAPDDATAILAAGSVVAAELREESLEDSLFDRPREVVDFDDWPDRPSAASRDRADEPGADDTLPPGAVTTGTGTGGRLRRVVTGPRRVAVLAGAAALVVAVTVVSTMLMLGGGDKGKTGHPVSDSQQPMAPSGSVVPSVPTASPSESPTRQEYVQPTLSPSDSPTPSPSDSITQTPSDRPTSPSPGPTEPTDEPTVPTETPTPPPEG